MTCHRTIDTPAGVLAYERTGHGSAVLLIHGCGIVGDGWRPQIDALADRFTLLAFDHRGLGGSELRGRLSVEGMAEDALAVLETERIERAHVVGHSLGGLIAQQLALVTPDRVASLSLLCTFAHGRQGARMTPGLALTALRMRIGTREMRRQAFVELVMPASYLAGVDRARLAAELQPLFGRDLGDNPSVILKQVAAMAKFDPRERLRALPRVPVLVVSAQQDRIALPAYGRELAGAIPGARYVEIAGAGHGVTIQRAPEINALLAQHFAAAMPTAATQV
jgi:3-oxoadipate enol-lactonase